jgi:hypothetical protein
LTGNELKQKRTQQSAHLTLGILWQSEHFSGFEFFSAPKQSHARPAVQ